MKIINFSDMKNIFYYKDLLKYIENEEKKKE